MREFQVRHKIRNFLYSKGLAVVLVGLILFVGRSTWSVFQKERESAENTALAEKELNRLEERKNLLQAEIGRLGTDEGVEEEIRSKYNVTKPGEKFFIIVNKDSPTSSLATTTPKTGLWEKALKLIGQ